MAMNNRPHKNLLVWSEGIELVSLIYKISKLLPDDEKFGIISQMRRAAISVPSNIAEGAARKSNKEFIQFLYIASGSLSELDTLNVTMRKLNYIDQKTYNDMEEKINKVSALLSGLIQKRKSSTPNPVIT